MPRTRNSLDNRDCPICIEELKLAVETNCGHLYCGQCIIQNWNENRSLEPMKCPYCRQKVILLLPCLTREEEQSIENEILQQKEEINRSINAYNRLNSLQNRSLWNQLCDLPTLLRHVWADLFTWRGLAFFYRIRIIMCFVTAFIYLLFPFDLIPEGFLGLFGLIDDLIIVGYLLIQTGIFYRNHIVNIGQN